MAEPAGIRSTSGRLRSGGAGGVHVSQEPSVKAGVVLSDERVDFLHEQVFCVLRVKTDKWNRFIAAEENQKVILDFLDHIFTSRLLLFTGPGGTLHAGDSQVKSAIRLTISKFKNKEKFTSINFCLSSFRFNVAFNFNFDVLHLTFTKRQVPPLIAIN